MRHRHPALLTLLALPGLLLLGACEQDPDPNNPGGQFGEETDGCQVVEEVALALDEVSELGFAAEEVLAYVEGEHAATLSWADGTSSGLVLVAAEPGNARLLRYEYVSSSGEEPDIYCGDELAVDLDLAVDSDDGRLAEDFEVTLVSEEGSLAWITVDLEALEGSLDIESFATESFDDIWADLHVELEASGLSGEIRGYGESRSGSGPDSAVSLTSFDIASF